MSTIASAICKHVPAGDARARRVATCAIFAIEKDPAASAVAQWQPKREKAERNTFKNR